MSRVRFLASAGTVLLVAVLVPATQASAPLDARSSGSTPGVPLGGPAVLYAPPPAVPQVQNHDPRFRAPYELVSGTERYLGGEYLYTDFLYDDDATTYPADVDRYGNNAADLVEYRMSVRGGDLAVRLSYTTLLAADSTIAVVAFDSDRDPTTGSDTLPRHPGQAFPGTDHVLTTWGTGSEWSTWTGSAWKTTALPTKTDLAANQVTTSVPPSVAQPKGTWSATLATGLYDPATRSWLPVESSHGSDIVNLGFRFDSVGPGTTPDGSQRAALSAGTPTSLAHDLDFDLLAARGTKDNVPTSGLVSRIFASRLKTADVITEPEVTKYERTPKAEGKFPGSIGATLMSPLQPYTVYVPKAYRPGTPAPMTFALHGFTGYHHWINSAQAMTEQLGDARGSIVLSPQGRSNGGFYVDEMEFDLFEAWNDVARHYSLDPLRTAVTGVSMGGYGAYRLGLLYPHLFSRALPVVPAGRYNIWVPGVNDDHTTLNSWLENARNLPVFHIGDTASELTFYPGQHQNAAGPAVAGYQSLDSLGYRYKLWAVAADHFLASNFDYPQATEFLGRHQIEPEPFHVTYTRMPSNERGWGASPDLGLRHDRAYWVSDIEIRDDTDRPGTVAGAPAGTAVSARPAKGVVDAVSLGFGKADPTSSVRHGAGVTPGGLPYAEQERVWSEPSAVPVENRILLTLTNIRTLTIDPAAARVGCDVDLDITSDGPVEVTLRGCGRSVIAGPTTPQEGL